VADITHRCECSAGYPCLQHAVCNKRARSCNASTTVCGANGKRDKPETTTCQSLLAPHQPNNADSRTNKTLLQT
jgi:hypothetical protein